MITFLVVESGSDPLDFRLDDSALFRGHSHQGRGLHQARDLGVRMRLNPRQEQSEDVLKVPHANRTDLVELPFGDEVVEMDEAVAGLTAPPG